MFGVNLTKMMFSPPKCTGKNY